MGLIAVPAGHVATVVTFLEMDSPPPEGPLPASPFRLERWEEPEPGPYRDLFRRVGGPWLWYSRLAMTDAELLAQFGEVHVARGEDGAALGFVELDFGAPGECLIRFLGLVPEHAGRGHGRWLFAETLRRAWRPGVARVCVTTCSLDHPAALPAYLRAGFIASKRAFESFPDPRLAGLLPPDCAPQVPIVKA